VTALSDLDAPLVRLPESGDSTYLMPSNRPLPTANFVLVLTAKEQNELMPTGVAASFAPRNMARGLALNYEKHQEKTSRAPSASATPPKESNLMGYNLYWGSDNQTDSTLHRSQSWQKRGKA
jgi:hypothetical protein